MFFFQRVQVPYAWGSCPEALASGKACPVFLTGLVTGDGSSEGSQTAKSGTDEQERYMRL